MGTEIVRLRDTPQRVQARLRERRFSIDLLLRVRWWKWLNEPQKR